MNKKNQKTSVSGVIFGIIFGSNVGFLFGIVMDLPYAIAIGTVLGMCIGLVIDNILESNGFASEPNKQHINKQDGGRGGIRTPDAVTRTPDFESGTFNQLSHPS